MFGLIVDRLRLQGFRRIGLFNWTEPFLNHTIDEYVGRAKACGFWVSLSSTLSLPRIQSLDATLLAGLDLLTVSVSGCDQETYQINHVGGTWQHVVANLRRVREAIQHHRATTLVDLRMLRFDYNAHQETQLRALADDMGFRFEVIEGVGNPRAGRQEVPANEHYLREGAQRPQEPSPEDQGRACELMFNQIAIDCRGDVYLCCVMPNYPAFRLGRFLEMSADQILLAKFTHSSCRSCQMPRRDRSESEDERVSAALRSGGRNRVPMTVS